MQKSEEEGRRQRDPGKPGVAAELVCLRSTGERASVSRAKKRDAGDESRVVTHWGADRPEGWWLVVVGKRWRALRRGVTRYELDIITGWLRQLVMNRTARQEAETHWQSPAGRQVCNKGSWNGRWC